ncbi:M3 family oligoendopeptidase, partial [Mammaliicoccus vitulinus]|uniref:M3 family oligoendopeptidase n=1 Tax=Mammaliicoccus vitulinus TaxID=71237 RepID=UPI003F97AE59
MAKLITREEQQEQYTWDLTTIFASDEAYEEAFKELETYLGKEERFKGHLKDSSDTLYQALLLDSEIDEKLGKVYVYAHLKHDQDTANDKYAGYEAKAATLANKFASAWSFILPELMSIDEETLNEFVASNNDLKRYQFDIEKLNKKRPHILSDKEEKILAEAGEALQTPSNVFGMFNNADLEFKLAIDKDGKEHELTQGTYTKLLESEDRVLRKSAYDNVYDAYGSHNNTLTATLSGKVKTAIFSSKVRQYQSAREQALSNNFIPEEVYDNLIDTVHKYLPLLHRYTELRKELLGLDEMHMYDMYTPLVKNSSFEMPYEEAKDWMVKALQPMGKEYIEVVEEGLNNRWVDVYENKGKRSGGYSSGAHLTNPFILLNWSDSISDLFTLIHEFGHSAHSYFSRKHQQSNESGYSIFVAEVASTTNEALLSEYMDKNLEDPEKSKYLLNQELERF